MGDAELEQWVKSGDNVKYCPDCGVRTEKDSGCNKIHCTRCDYSWCWLCRCKFWSYEHYGKFNPTGCPHMYEGKMTCCSIFFLSLCAIICAPIVLVIGPFVMIPVGCIAGGCQIIRHCPLACIIMCPITLALGLAVGTIVAPLSLAIFYIPIILYSIIRMFKGCNIYHKWNICPCLTCII